MPPIKVKGQGHTKEKNVHNMSHGDTPICQNLVCLCQRAKTSCQYQIHCENINFDIEVKGQGHECICDTSYYGDTLTCQTKYAYVKGQIKIESETLYKS